MSLESFIARRYLSTRRKPLFVSFLMIISLSAVAVGVFALIFVLSVMNGFERDFRQKVLGFKAPVVVWSKSGADLSDQAGDWQKRDSRIQRAVPFAEGEAVAQTETGETTGLRVRGIGEAPSEERVGRLYQEEDFGEDGMVVGEELADVLHVNPVVSEKVRLIFPLGDVGPTGDLIPRVRPLRVVGIFHSGFYDFDSKYALIPYTQAIKLFGSEARTGLELWLDDYNAAEAVKEKLLASHPGGDVAIQTWRDDNPKLFAAMQLEKIGMFLLLGMLLLIASFNIFGLTSLVVMDKIKDMAILRSIGLTAGKLRKIFLLKAAGIAGTGAFSGGALGLVTTWLLQKYPVKMPATYYVETLPIRMDWADVAVILMIVPLMAILAAFYPAHQASRVTPVEALRYE